MEGPIDASEQQCRKPMEEMGGATPEDCITCSAVQSLQGEEVPGVGEGDAQDQ